MKRNHLFFFILAIFSVKANALLPYKYNWTKIKTPHFTVIVDEAYSEYGKTVAQTAEEAFDALQVFSPKHPKRTFIIVDHTKGFSNGSATMFPYPIITLQPIPPSPRASVGQYRDWLYELLVHEYTHILSFHNTRGLFTPLRWIFGSSISPAYFMPTWYQEGLAVYTETHLSDGGRLRGTYYNSLKNELKGGNIAIANESGLNKFPFGSSHYVYGAWLNQDNIGAQGIEGAAKVHKTFSGRIPYFINGGYKRHSKTSLYKSWRSLFSKNKETTATDGSHQGELPFYHKKSNGYYYLALDPYLNTELRFKSIKENKSKLLLKRLNIEVFKPYKRKIFFISLQVYERDQRVYSLYSYDLDSEKTTQLTSNENVLALDVSESGQILIVTSNLKGQKLHLISKIPDEKISLQNEPTAQVLFDSDAEARIALPRFVDKDNIVFSFKKPNQDEEVLRMNLKSLESRPIYKDTHITYITQNKPFYILSESQGLKSMYSLESNQKINLNPNLVSLTNLGEDRFLSSRVTNKGLYVFQENLETLKSNSKTPVLITNQSPKKEELSSDFSSSFKTKKYSSFSKLKPHYVVPLGTVSPYGFSGAFLYGLSVGSQDPLGLNSYSLSISTDTITDQVSGSFDYSSQHTRFPIYFSAGLNNQPLTESIFRESVYSSLGTTYVHTNSFDQEWTFSMYGLWNSTEFSENQSVERAGLSLGVSLKDSILRPRELAPRRGYTASLTGRHYVEDEGSFFGYSQAQASFKLFLTSPLQKTHRIILGFDGELNSKGLPFLFSTNSANLPYRLAGAGSFALRGLPTGALLATDSFTVGHLEYRLPIININWGPGLLPGFFQRIHGAVTADYGSTKGADLINGLLIDHSTPLYSAGAELIFEGKAFYHLPASLQIGVYKFLNDQVYSGPPELFIGFGLSGLP